MGGWCRHGSGDARCAVACSSRHFGLCRGRLVRRHGALGRVVVDIKSRPLEVQARRGQRALQHSLADRAHHLLLGAEALDLLKVMAALGTAIRIQRQSLLPFGEK